jgi:hypothetical protein
MSASSASQVREFERFECDADARHGMVSPTAALAAWDGQIRLNYPTAVHAAVEQIREQARSGAISWQTVAGGALAGLAAHRARPFASRLAPSSAPSSAEQCLR